VDDREYLRALGKEIDPEKLARLSSRQRDAVYGALKEIAYKRRTNPLAFYSPHSKQEQFHSFRTKVKVFAGGNQSGKTTAGIADDLIQAIDAEVLPAHLRPYKKFRPPFNCRIMAPSIQVVETVLFPKIQEMVPRMQLVGESWNSAYDKQLRILHFKNGSMFSFFTYEQDKSKLGGWTGHRIHYDEEPPEAFRGELQMRTMVKGGDEIFTMTPVEGLTWTYNEFGPLCEIAEIADGNYAAEEEISVVVVRMEDNPALSDEQIDHALRGLSNEERQARQSGRFVAIHGRIYDDYDPTTHYVPERPLPENVNIVVGIDPGMRYACGVVWAYLTAGDTMVAFNEGYFQNMTIGQICERIHLANGEFEIQPIYYVIDPAARNRNNQTGRSDQMEFADHGIVAIAGQNAVRPGINRVKERFQTNRLFVTQNCAQLDHELRRYRWRKPPISGEENVEKPVKKDDHLLDALRYVVMSRPYLPENPVEETETALEKMMREDWEGRHSGDPLDMTQNVLPQG
jgi:phage terminase large subunit-like protein